MSVCCRLINTKIGSNGFICINICKIISFQRKIPKYLCILGRDVSNHVPIKVLWFIQFRFYLWPLCHGRTSISTCYPLTSTEIQIDISINFLLEPQLKFKYEYWKSGWRLIFWKVLNPFGGRVGQRVGSAVQDKVLKKSI